MHSRRIGWTLAAALALLVGANPARALSLAEAVAGASLASTDGSLLFRDFDAVVTGDLSRDLADYELVAVERGFRVVGPVGVADGNVGDLLLSYTAEAAGSLLINGVSLLSNLQAVGDGSFANVAADLFAAGPDPIVRLFVFATGGGGFDETDDAAIQPALGSLRIAVDDILVSSSGPGAIATLSLVEQTFSVIPEPATLFLLVFGGAGLALVRRKRA